MKRIRRRIVRILSLHFMAEKDMLVHLTSANSKDGESDGTAVTSKQEKLPEAMRISFTADGKTWVYDPGMGDRSAAENGLKLWAASRGAMIRCRAVFAEGAC